LPKYIAECYATYLLSCHVTRFRL